jgi:hypothetical protein
VTIQTLAMRGNSGDQGATGSAWERTPVLDGDACLAAGASRLARKFIMAGDDPPVVLQGRGHLDQARDDLLAFTAFPREVWRQP